MIDRTTQKRVQKITSDFWQKKVLEKGFIKTASGKEIGHRIADIVEEHTAKLLEGQFTTKFQCGKNGKRVSRGLGDIWLQAGGIYNPINIKSGEANKKGQPNMVSLKKLLKYVLDRKIDSYYLLFVKMIITAGKPIKVVTHFVDMLDYLEYVTFDSGPGQIMLKETAFDKAIRDKTKPSGLTLLKKAEKLFMMLRDGDARLLRNRQRAQGSLARQMLQLALDQPINQSELNLR